MMTTLLAAVSIGVVVGLALFWAHVRWARWIAAGPSAAPWTKHVAGVIVFGWVLGVTWTLYGIARAFADTESPAFTDDDLSPAQRAWILAGGISEVVNGSAFAVAWWILCALVLVALSFRYRWSARARAPRA